MNKSSLASMKYFKHCAIVFYPCIAARTFFFLATLYQLCPLLCAACDDIHCRRTPRVNERALLGVLISLELERADPAVLRSVWVVLVTLTFPKIDEPAASQTRIKASPKISSVLAGLNTSGSPFVVLSFNFPFGCLGLCQAKEPLTCKGTDGTDGEERLTTANTLSSTRTSFSILFF